MQQVLEILGLATLIFVCCAFTIGLTFAPCYSALCSEDLYPSETRIHVAVFYALLGSTGLALLLRAHLHSFYQISATLLTKKPLPIFGKRLSLGALLLGLWTVGIVLATTGVWVIPEVNYWKSKFTPVRWASANGEMVATVIIGHHIDMLLGLVIIPVSRNSILGRVFKVHQSTLLYTHKLFAYLLFVGVVAHFIAYMVFIGDYNSRFSGQENFDINQPQFTKAEAANLNPYYLSVLGSGLAAGGLMLVIVITALPALRRRAYNTFYYAHVICSILIFVATCIHASTDFYCLLPGLLLWVADWAWRLFAGGFGSSKTIPAEVEDAGNGWYRISLPVGAKIHSQGTDVESVVAKNRMTTHPIQSYYLSFTDVSRIQNHPFTAVSVGDDIDGPTFLFQRATGKTQSKLDKEWTWKLGALASPLSADKVDAKTTQSIARLPVRIEGPYVPDTPEVLTSDHIICIAGGTGITGAISIANWWVKNRSDSQIRHDSIDSDLSTKSSIARLSLIWTVRYADMAQVREWSQLVEHAQKIDGLDIQLRVSSTDGRLDCAEFLASKILRPGSYLSSEIKQQMIGQTSSQPWVYVSGPEGLLRSAETACIEVRRQTKDRHSLNWYIANWEV